MLVRCSFVHSQIYPGSKARSCQENANGALLKFAEGAGLTAASAKYPWCRDTDYFYGNFVGGTSYFLRSPANTILNTWLYECVPEGYFKHRFFCLLEISLVLFKNYFF